VTTWRADYLKDHAPATANLVLRYLKAWCRWAMANGWLPAVPFDLKPVRWQQLPRTVLQPGQVASFLAGVDEDPRGDNAPVRAAVRFMLGLGLREAEVLGARWEWLRDGSYTVGKAKGKRGRSIPVPAWVQAAMAELPRADLGLIFPGDKGRPHPHGWLRKAISRGCRAVGLPPIGAHRLRATFATLHAGSGTPMVDLQAMMGHASITTTRGYVEDDADRRKSAQDALSKMLGFA
jgi:integrase